MSPLITALIVFALSLGGAAVGATLRRSLPNHYLGAESKEFVRLGSNLIATIAALVLGLLISSAKSSYDAQHNEVRQMAANLVLPDGALERYGPETRAVRMLLRRAIDPWVESIWREQTGQSRQVQSLNPAEAAELAYAGILELAPQNDTQRLLKSQAAQTVTSLGQSRLLLFEQSDGSIQLPFLAVLVFWLTC